MTLFLSPQGRIKLRIGLTLALGLVLSAVALPDVLTDIRPDFALLILIMWCWKRPDYVGVGVAFGVGLLADAMHFIVLGVNAFSYVVVVYLAILSAKRILSSTFLIQLLIVFLLLVVNSIISNTIYSVLHGSYSLGVWFAPLTGVLLWTITALSWRPSRD